VRKQTNLRIPANDGKIIETAQTGCALAFQRFNARFLGGLGRLIVNGKRFSPSSESNRGGTQIQGRPPGARCGAECGATADVYAKRNYKGINIQLSEIHHRLGSA
jgi:hypothetical protein